MKTSYRKIVEKIKIIGMSFLHFFVDHLSVSLILILLVGVGFAANVFYQYVWLVEKSKPNTEVRVQKIKKELFNSVTGDLTKKAEAFKRVDLPVKRDIFR